MGGILGNWWFGVGDSWGLMLRWENATVTAQWVRVLPRADFRLQKHSARAIRSHVAEAKRAKARQETVSRQITTAYCQL